MPIDHYQSSSYASKWSCYSTAPYRIYDCATIACVCDPSSTNSLLFLFVIRRNNENKKRIERTKQYFRFCVPFSVDLFETWFGVFECRDKRSTQPRNILIRRPMVNNQPWDNERFDFDLMWFNLWPRAMWTSAVLSAATNHNKTKEETKKRNFYESRCRLQSAKNTVKVTSLECSSRQGNVIWHSRKKRKGKMNCNDKIHERHEQCNERPIVDASVHYDYLWQLS